MISRISLTSEAFPRLDSPSVKVFNLDVSRPFEGLMIELELHTYRPALPWQIAEYSFKKNLIGSNLLQTTTEGMVVMILLIGLTNILCVSPSTVTSTGNSL